jgi:hypothetical protein
MHVSRGFRPKIKNLSTFYRERINESSPFLSPSLPVWLIPQQFPLAVKPLVVEVRARGAEADRLHEPLRSSLLGSHFITAARIAGPAAKRGCGFGDKCRVSCCSSLAQRRRVSGAGPEALLAQNQQLQQQQ